MGAYTDVVSKAGDRVIDTVKQAEDLTVNAVSGVTERIGGLLPTLPAIPFADQLPRPEELVKISFNFTQRLVETQKDYALALVKALEPITKMVFGPAKRQSKTTESA